MKVKDLIEMLSEFDPELDVIIAADAEGNGYSPCADSYDLGQYIPESTWSGEFRSSQHDVDDGGCEEKDINAIVIGGIN